MTEIYLHIGMDKTGTTSIQRYLSENCASIESEIYYPTSITDFQSFNHEFITALAVSEQYIPPDTLERCGGHERAFHVADAWMQALCALWQKHHHNKIILSSEAFYSLPYYGVLNLRKILDAFNGAQVKIICSVDVPSSRYRSQCIQLIVEGYGIRPPHAQQVSQYIDQYLRVFGPDCMTILDFSESKQRRRVVSDFLGVLGSDSSAEPSGYKENSSMSAEALQLALDLDDSIPRYRRFEELARLFFVDQLVPEFSSPVLHEDVSKFVDVASTDYNKLSEFLAWRATNNDEINPDMQWNAPCCNVADIFVFNRDRYLALCESFHHGVKAFNGN